MKGELLLIDREINNAKQKSGIKLYDTLYDKWFLRETREPLPKFDGLEAAFLAAIEDLKDLNDKRMLVDEKIDKLEDKGSSETPSAGQWMADAASMTKLKAEMAYYNQELKVRQEIFGIQIFDDLDLLSKDTFEGEIGEVLNTCKLEMLALLEKKKAKEEELAAV